MKINITELIKKLEEIKEKHGDLLCVTAEPDRQDYKDLSIEVVKMFETVIHGASIYTDYKDRYTELKSIGDVVILD